MTQEAPGSFISKSKPNYGVSYCAQGQISHVGKSYGIQGSSGPITSDGRGNSVQQTAALAQNEG